jgi:hemerythrin-like domain-containing protein
MNLWHCTALAAKARLVALGRPVLRWIKSGVVAATYASRQQELPMSSTSPPVRTSTATVKQDGFEVLDACHRQTLVMLDKLATLVAGLDNGPPDPQARATAGEVVQFFSTTARQHHEDEERHVFPQLQDSADPEIVQAVLRLQQDHLWMDIDWRELGPVLAAIAGDQGGYDLAALREGVEIFTVLSNDHITLEESCIYPQARLRMRSPERQHMAQEMAERRRARLAAQASAARSRR